MGLQRLTARAIAGLPWADLPTPDDAQGGLKRVYLFNNVPDDKSMPADAVRVRLVAKRGVAKAENFLGSSANAWDGQGQACFAHTLAEELGDKGLRQAAGGRKLWEPSRPTWSWFSRSPRLFATLIVKSAK